MERTITAIVRNENGYKVLYLEDDRTLEELRKELKGNGYKVSKLWNGEKSYKETDEWLWMNRK